MKPIAIVTPWFGEALKGGAEQQAWQLAHRLSKQGISIEVLTTCRKSFFADWGTNHLKPGKNTENGFTIQQQFSKLLRKGRADLNLLSKSFSIAAGYSAYNSAELEQAGFCDPQIMPIPATHTSNSFIA